jgi:hypothetical protein
MKRKNIMLLAVAMVAAVLTINLQAMPVACSVTYQDGLTLGECTYPTILTTQTATVKIVISPPCPQCKCYRAEILNPFAFSLTDVITLPEVGKELDGGKFDQTFHDTTKTHEDWHHNYNCALAVSTYGALETWSSTYFSDCCLTVADAFALATADLQNALTTAITAFNVNIDKQLDFETAAGSYCHIVGGVWRSVNPDWGQAAVDFANAVTVNFTKGPGNCPCIPEPATIMFLSLGGWMLLRRRKG